MILSNILAAYFIIRSHAQLLHHNMRESKMDLHSAAGSSESRVIPSCCMLRSFLRMYVFEATICHANEHSSPVIVNLPLILCLKKKNEHSSVRSFNVSDDVGHCCRLSRCWMFT